MSERSYITSILLAVALLIVNTSSTFAAESCDPMHVNTIDRGFVGNTVIGKSPKNGKTYREFLSADKYTILQSASGRIIVGKWKFSGTNQICFRYGENACQRRTKTPPLAGVKVHHFA